MPQFEKIFLLNKDNTDITLKGNTVKHFKK